jgi:hypothetical protein
MYFSITAQEVTQMATEGTKKVFPVFAEGECSEHFLATFSHERSIAISCEQCGRTHFNAHESPGFFDPGELEDLQVRNEADSNACIANDCAIDWSRSPIDGKQFVFGCPCHYDGLLENIVWGARHDIARYFVARAEAEKREADRMAELASDALKAVNNT